MRVLAIYLLLAVSLLLTVSMALFGGKLVLTTEYGNTYFHSPFWLLLIQLPMAVAFLFQNRTGAALALGACGGFVMGMAMELYVYLHLQNPLMMLTVRFLVAHIAVLSLLAVLGCASFRYFHE